MWVFYHSVVDVSTTNFPIATRYDLACVFLILSMGMFFSIINDEVTNNECK